MKDLRNLIIMISLFLSTSTRIAQQINIKGIITSLTDNEPLIGVNVSVSGTMTGTITDFNGEFSINADPDATLLFSYIYHIIYRGYDEIFNT